MLVISVDNNVILILCLLYFRATRYLNWFVVDVLHILFTHAWPQQVRWRGGGGARGVESAILCESDITVRYIECTCRSERSAVLLALQPVRRGMSYTTRYYIYYTYSIRTDGRSTQSIDSQWIMSCHSLIHRRIVTLIGSLVPHLLYWRQKLVFDLQEFVIRGFVIVVNF